RGAAVYATSGADTLGAGSRSASGPRFLVYSGLNLPAGRSSLSLYAYDRYRLRPHGYDSTVVQVPRGNVLALGVRLDRPLSPVLSLAPNVEFRHELAGPATGSLALLGWLVRPGVDVRYRASAAWTVLVQGQVAFGRAADNATLSVPVVVIGRSQPFEVTLQGIRSSDGVVLYAGVDTVIVSSTGATPPVTVPVSYIGPCQIGSGCVVTVAPQDTTLATGGSLVMRISVDSALIPVTGVPVALTNLTPALILMPPDRTVTALPSLTGGPGRVEAAIRGAADTLRLNVASLTAPAAVLVNPGYVTLTTLSPGNTAQLVAVVTDM